MDVVIERNEQTWCFSVAMSSDALHVKLRAYYDGPLPDREKPFAFGAPRVVVAPRMTRWWRADGDKTIEREDVPLPAWMAAEIDREIAKVTKVDWWRAD